MLFRSGALGLLWSPLPPGSDCGGAEPARQGLQLGHTQPQLPLEPAGAPDLLGLVKGEHADAWQPVDGAVVVPVPPGHVEQHLDLGPAGVDPVVDDVCVDLPVEGEERRGGGGGGGGGGGSGERPRVLEQVQGDWLLNREGPVAGVEGRHPPSLLDEEGFCSRLEAGVPHQVLIGLLQEEGGVGIQDLVADG